MNPLVARQTEESVESRFAAEGIGLGCEAQLRAAAATLRGASPSVITAATVVGIFGQDDAAAIETLVADIADEFQLMTEFRLHLGSFSVRFSRR